MPETAAAGLVQRPSGADMNFDTAFTRVLGAERGYVNSPADPGGETNWGISKRSYPNVDIAALTQDDAKAIYKRDYWDAASCDQLPFALGFQVFDAAVQHGVHTALSFLTDSGEVHKFMGRRIEYYVTLGTWAHFGKGWMNRMAKNLEYLAEDV